MISKKDLEKQVFIAARDQGISSVLFRNAMGRKLGLNITDWECLSFITITGIATPTELARYTGLTTGSATAMLDRLEKSKLITRKPNPKDRRGILIEINKESAEVTRKLVADIQLAHHKLIASYTSKELETIIDFLTRFTKNVKDHTEKIEKDVGS
jgi:DNA-binding MarR family transcriptional regulator